MTRHPGTALGDRLAALAQHIERTAATLQLPDAPDRHGGLGPLLRQLHTVQDLGQSVMNELLRTDAGADESPEGRHFTAELTTAYAHCAHAVSNLSTALAALAEAHRAALRPGNPRHSENRLGFTLGHAAALRSLQRARNGLEEGATHLISNAFAPPPQLPPPPLHTRTADQSGHRPTRHRP